VRIGENGDEDVITVVSVTPVALCKMLHLHCLAIRKYFIYICEVIKSNQKLHENKSLTVLVKG